MLELDMKAARNQKPPGCPPISVIICARNEAKNLPGVLPKIPSWIDEVILVDGNSTDQTVETALKILPLIRILHQPGMGKGEAIKIGVVKATGDIIVTLDADGQSNPEELVRFIVPLMEGYDVAKGTRLADGRPRNMTLLRWIGNKILTCSANVLFHARYTDICSGYNAFWKTVFLSLKLDSRGFEMEQQMIAGATRAGFKVVEVQHLDRGRMEEKSKVRNWKQGLLDLWIIIRERFR